MDDYRFFHPIEVRYADIDAQRHVNNVQHFSYMEQARATYLLQLGLWEGEDFDAIGIILAEQRCTYHAPIPYGQALQVGVRTHRMGDKSIEMHYSIQDAQTHRELASGQATLVAYDYREQQSIPIPAHWRRVIREYDSPSESERFQQG
jgi:acyl-CoA thioester hydrolase